MSQVFTKEMLDLLSSIQSYERYEEGKQDSAREVRKEILMLERNLASARDRLKTYIEDIETYETKLAGYKHKLAELLGIESMQQTLPIPPGQCYVGDGSLAGLEKRTDGQS